MKEQNIDKLFKSGLADLSTPPPPHIWSNIQTTVAQSKSGRKVFFLRIAGVAAALAIAIISIVLLSDKQNSQPKLAENNTTQTKEENKVLQIQPTKDQKDIVVVVSNEFNDKSKEKKYLADNSLEQDPQKEITQNEREQLSGLTYLKSIGNSFLPILNFKESLRSIGLSRPDFAVLESERELIAMNVLTLSKEKENVDRWKVGVLLSPGYSSHSVSYSDTYKENMTSESMNGYANIGGGFSVEYKTDKKWSVESGVYYSQNGQKSSNSNQLFTSNKYYSFAVERDDYATAVAVTDGDILLNSTAGVIQLNETPSDAQLYASLATEYDNSVSLQSSGDYYQVFDFVEVPIYLRYKLLESKFDVQLMGGISTNFLIGNQVYIEDGGVSQKVGKTNNISSVNYSGTVGVGIEYGLGKHLSLTVEPRINYYLSSINKSSDVDYRPYRIGVYTGLNYTF